MTKRNKGIEKLAAQMQAILTSFPLDRQGAALLRISRAISYAMDPCEEPYQLPELHRLLDRIGKGGDEQTCMRCGCTWEFGCGEGCSWVEEDLCSACAPEPRKRKRKRLEIS